MNLNGRLRGDSASCATTRGGRQMCPVRAAKRFGQFLPCGRHLLPHLLLVSLLASRQLQVLGGKPISR